VHFKRSLVSACAAAVLAGPLTFVSTAVHASDAVVRPARSVDISGIRIDNFGQVNPNFFRGEQPEGRDYADLAALGVKTVIDLRADYESSEPRLVEAAGMKYVRIPMTMHVRPTSEQLELFLQIVNTPAQQPVYVHCKGGRHRTGVMTAVYRMEQDGWTADQAFREMKRYKFGMEFLHSEFKDFVYGYKPGRMLAAKGSPATPTN
jgi:tyrosine-protein phosphatase SIW14